jgi:archaea-specific DNA-binding protein
MDESVEFNIADKVEFKVDDDNRDLKVSDKESNVIFVGGKPLVNYVRSILSRFRKHGASNVVVKSRGRYISKAVDAVEVSRRALQENSVSIKDVSISSESFEKDGKTTNISAMDIVLGV